MNIQIRRATLHDKVALRALVIKTFRDTFDEHNTAEDMEQYVSKSFSEVQIEKELQEANTVFFLAVDGDRIAGYAKVREGEKQEVLGSKHALELHRIYVDKDYFGKRSEIYFWKHVLTMRRRPAMNGVAWRLGTQRQGYCLL